jgi:hypothetical protein
MFILPAPVQTRLLSKSVQRRTLFTDKDIILSFLPKGNQFLGYLYDFLEKYLQCGRGLLY